jgi:hypothetical protein
MSCPDAIISRGEKEGWEGRGERAKWYSRETDDYATP